MLGFVGLAALPATAGADKTILPSGTVTTPTVPPLTVTVPNTPINVSTPAVGSVSVQTPPVTLPDAQVPAPPVTTPVTPPTVTPPTVTTPVSGGNPGGQSATAPIQNSTPTSPTGGGGGSSGSGGGGSSNRKSLSRSHRRSTTGAGTTTIVNATPTADVVNGGISAPVSKSSPQHKPQTFGTRIVHALPAAVEVALIALVVIASLMSIDAYLQGRRARRLKRQREGLLDDVGLLQAALLPHVPDHAGDLAVSVGYRPAQGLAAGGDFYDVFQLDGNRTGIILGDVSGHGRESLIQAALVRYTLRTLMGEGHSLGEVLARADRYLEAEMGANFATVIVATYDHAGCELRYAKAGHEPPLITGLETAGEESATPLGLGLAQEWPEFSHQLMPDETVCFYTDGLKEARRDGEQLGREYIERLVRSGLDAQQLIARVQADADTAGDDLAAVVLRMDESQPFGRFERTLSSASSSSPTA
ncbi:MAG TPA: PP2C family protein-serine/threonine phosphatase [Thermoleophilaceae bacterium]|nr:PP2C family protein-serine/threonine phosphatase [Thermoleophilaceae bacterium]